ncbi:MAG TPA: MEDS domain-containing protein, partial [Polyangiaceae bacterium]|nr:MEDS domain-containing protein [Polyangiaceae bacterium]
MNEEASEDAGPGTGKRHESGLHAVHFYEDEKLLVEMVAEFIGGGLRAGTGALIVATQLHLAAFTEELKRQVDMDALGGRLILLDAEQTLSRISAEGIPDAQLFNSFFDEA